MRLFIAVPLPPDVHRALAQVQKRLRESAAGGRYVPNGNFHITLQFLGESDALHGAAAACDDAVRGIRPFVLRLDGYGSFARGERRTGYVSLKGDLEELYRLHETLTSALLQNGFLLAGGRKRLTPHITLARDVSHAEAVPPGMREACAALGGGSAFTVDTITLFESSAVHGRMVYTPLHRARILK